MIKFIDKGIYTAAYQDLIPIDRSEFKIEQIVDVRHLVDKSGNNISYILKCISDAKRVLQSQDKVVIACDMGISRSRVIAIGLLADLGREINDSISHVLSTCGYPEINPDLLFLLKQYYSKEGSYEKEEIEDVVVLGSSGFLGSVLTEFLSTQGLKVGGISRNNIDLKRDPIGLITRLQLSTAKKVILCVHPSSHHTSSSLADALHITRHTLEACRISKKELLYISSMAVYFGNAHLERNHQYIANETDHAVPRGAYSEAKYLCERLIDSYQINYGVKSTIIRPCGLYGPSMRPQWLIPKLIHLALSDQAIFTHRYGNGLPTFELLFINDFCEALLVLLLGGCEQTYINVGCHSLISTSELANLIVRLCNSKSATNLLDISDQVYNIVSSYGTIDKLRWSPKTSIEDGLRLCINSIME